LRYGACIDQYPEEARCLARAFGNYFRLQVQRGVSQSKVKGIQGKYELVSGGIIE